MSRPPLNGGHSVEQAILPSGKGSDVARRSASTRRQSVDHQERKQQAIPVADS